MVAYRGYQLDLLRQLFIQVRTQKGPPIYRDSHIGSTCTCKVYNKMAGYRSGPHPGTGPMVKNPYQGINMGII